VRPNQVLAVGGLPLSLLQGSRARRLLSTVEQQLLTPMGLRSLAPGEPGYIGRCQGDVAQRDGAYHQGTVWPWLIGPFVEAWLLVRGRTPRACAEARIRFLDPLVRHLRSAGIGHLSEIADGDAPHTPRGCPFQAWSLGELLRLERRVLVSANDPTGAGGDPDASGSSVHHNVHHNGHHSGTTTPTYSLTHGATDKS
jgi:glycogen debranching enzyme